jgi:transcriptional regulator with XRE-family HTH domain
MGTSTWFDNEISALEDDLDFLTEEMTFDIVNEIRRVMKEEKISQTGLAIRIGKSRAYISKILNYSPNMTIHSLAMVAMALGLRWTRPHLVKKSSVDSLDSQLISCHEYTMQTAIYSRRTAPNHAIYFNKDEYQLTEKRGNSNGKQPISNAA